MDATNVLIVPTNPESSVLAQSNWAKLHEAIATLLAEAGHEVEIRMEEEAAVDHSPETKPDGDDANTDEKGENAFESMSDEKSDGKAAE